MVKKNNNVDVVKGTFANQFVAVAVYEDSVECDEIPSNVMLMVSGMLRMFSIQLARIPARTSVECSAIPMETPAL